MPYSGSIFIPHRTHLWHQLVQPNFECLTIYAYTPTHITTDSSEPAEHTSPMGNSVSGYSTDARYDIGMRTQTIDTKL